VAALENARINPDKQLCTACNFPAPVVHQHGPALVEAINNKIVYEVTIDLIPDAGLGIVPADPDETFADDQDNTVVAPTVTADKVAGQRYPP
jgi:hypothetical protein